MLNETCCKKGQEIKETIVETVAIGKDRIDAMVKQIRSLQAKMMPPANEAVASAHEIKGNVVVDSTQPTKKVDFANALKSALDGVNELQVKSEQLAAQFELGNDDVQLSDVMISMAKANVALQVTIQARNRVVQAYQDIMTMQI